MAKNTSGVVSAEPRTLEGIKAEVARQVRAAYKAAPNTIGHKLCFGVSRHDVTDNELEEIKKHVADVLDEIDAFGRGVRVSPIFPDPKRHIRRILIEVFATVNSSGFGDAPV